MSQEDRAKFAYTTGVEFAKAVAPRVKNLRSRFFEFDETVERLQKAEEQKEKQFEKSKKKYIKNHIHQTDLYGFGPTEEELEEKAERAAAKQQIEDDDVQSESGDTYYHADYKLDESDPISDLWMLDAITRFTEYVPKRLLACKPIGSIVDTERVTWLVLHKPSGEDRVLSIARDLGPTFRELGDIPREVANYVRLGNGSDYICSLERWCWVNDNVYAIVTQYVPHVSSEHIHRDDKNAIARYIFCVASALKHMKECGVVHRDIAPSNIWWDPIRRVAVVGDLDQSAPYRPEGFVTKTGRPAFNAPEKQTIIDIREKNRKRGNSVPPKTSKVYRTKSDVYSLGVIAHMLYYGLKKPEKKIRRWRLGAAGTDPGMKMIKGMVHEDPKIRIRLCDIFKHDFLKLNNTETHMDRVAQSKLIQAFEEHKKYEPPEIDDEEVENAFNDVEDIMSSEEEEEEEDDDDDDTQEDDDFLSDQNYHQQDESIYGLAPLEELDEADDGDGVDDVVPPVSNGLSWMK